MNKTNVLLSATLAVSIAIVLQSCKKDKDEDPAPTPPPVEFVADDQTFAGFANWVLEATNQGPDPALGMAHGGNDSTVTRFVYFKDGQDPVNATYPQGTLIVKNSTNPSQTVNEFTAMAKRGANFNSSNNGWEWFMLNQDGSIATDSLGNKLRGANLMGGMCGGCHSQVSSKDFIFTK